MPDEADYPTFEEEAERAETEAVLDKDLEDTFPTSDPPSNWAGPDVEPERPEPDRSPEAVLDEFSQPG
jgi:hypothetical protein